MKKISLISLILILSFSIGNADYLDESINYFKNAPSKNEIDLIEDPELKYCEETFLKAYMRREFTEEENNKCREIFNKRIEGEINYKIQSLKNRGVY